MAQPYTTVDKVAFPFGVLTSVRLPSEAQPVPAKVLKQLRPEERQVAEGLSGYRQMTWTGGKLALHKPLGALGVRHGPLLSGPYGEPLLPAGFSGSISHKGDLVVALAAREDYGTVGVDLEDPSGPSRDVARKILCDEEMDWVNGLPAERQWPATLMHFSLKEAIYKALFPHVRRYVGFKEARLRIDVNDLCEAHLRLQDGEGPFTVEARLHWLGDKILSAARIQAES